MTIDEVTEALTPGCCSETRARENGCVLCCGRFDAVAQVKRWHDELLTARADLDQVVSTVVEYHQAATALDDYEPEIVRVDDPHDAALTARLAACSDAFFAIVHDRVVPSRVIAEENAALRAELHRVHRGLRALLDRAVIDLSRPPATRSDAHGGHEAGEHPTSETPSASQAAEGSGEGWCYSDDGESFSAATSREDAIESLAVDVRGLVLGDAESVTVVRYIGRSRRPDHIELLPSADSVEDWLVEALQEQACDLCGDWAEGYPGLSTKDETEMAERVRDVVAAFLRERAPRPSFFLVESSQQIHLRVHRDGTHAEVAGFEGEVSP